jgi:opacity protein-like surface antigen
MKKLLLAALLATMIASPAVAETVTAAPAEDPMFNAPYGDITKSGAPFRGKRDIISV